MADAARAWDLWSKPSAAGLVGTIRVETGSTFAPVRESYWLSEAQRRVSLARYYPYYGRGFIQLTWNYNYQTYGNLIGQGDALLHNPDLALDPNIAAQVMAAYWSQRGIRWQCEAGNWREVRRLVQGASAGLSEFTIVANALAW